MLYDNGNESGIPNQVVFNASCFHNRFRVYYRFHIIIVS